MPTPSRKAQIDLWRERSAETRAEAEQRQDGSVSYLMLMTIAETYERLAGWEEERNLPADDADC
jgi:hypothetical protein